MGVHEVLVKRTYGKRQEEKRAQKVYLKKQWQTISESEEKQVNTIKLSNFKQRKSRDPQLDSHHNQITKK